MVNLQPRRAAAGVLALGLAFGAAAQANAAAFVFTGGATSYSQNFDTLATSGTTNTVLPAGVALDESGGGNRDNDAYAAGDGGSNTGDTYSFGTGTSTDRALGGLRSGTLIPNFGFVFTNDTGREITALNVDFVGEMWRLGTVNRADRLNFEYAIGTTSLTTGAFVGVGALDFVSPNTAGAVGSRNGNDAAYRTALASTISGISIAQGQSFVFRFVDFDASGADDGLAIDDFNLSLTLAPVAGVPEPATWAMMIGGFALAGGAVRRRRNANSVLA